jgi:tagaturonate reductase
MYDRLAEQEGLFHLLLTGSRDGQPVSDTQLISSISRVINPNRNYADYAALARQPEIRFIVSNTTEAGITFDASDRPEDDPPASFPAKLTVFLHERYRHFSGAAGKGCIIFPCELIEQNGAQLRRCVLDYVALWQLGDDFRAWLEQSSVFCNTLVDRIVPGFPHDRAEAIRRQVGFDDQLLVEAEQYHTWVIEAPAWVQQAFPADQAGLNVKFVGDVRPYRDLKVRILNGAHTAMVPAGYLYGLRTIREAVEDAALGRFITGLLFDEVLPTLDSPAAEREQMARDVLHRFRNPYLKHQLITISLNSTSKFKARVLPSLLTYADQTGQPPKRISLALAALIRFYKGEWRGKPIPVQDEPAAMAWWQEVWQAGLPLEERAAKALKNETVWGQDLTAVPHLHALVTHYLTLIEKSGMAAALEEIDG